MGRTLTFTWNGLNFEFDEEKSQKNVTDYTPARLPFTEAYRVRESPFGGIRKAPTDEVRWIRRGYIGDDIWFCVYTDRGQNYRLISLRPANERERNLP